MWYDRVKKNPLQEWIDLCCSISFPLLHPPDGIFHSWILILLFMPTMIEIPTYKHSDFDISLFFTITKHIGKGHCTFEELRWFHWLTSYIWLHGCICLYGHHS
jgi:hypothetical protein